MAPSLEGTWSNHSFPGESDGASIALSSRNFQATWKVFIHSFIHSRFTELLP